MPGMLVYAGLARSVAKRLHRCWSAAFSLLRRSLVSGGGSGFLLFVCVSLRLGGSRGVLYSSLVCVCPGGPDGGRGLCLCVCTRHRRRRRSWSTGKLIVIVAHGRCLCVSGDAQARPLSACLWRRAGATLVCVSLARAGVCNSKCTNPPPGALSRIRRHLCASRGRHGRDTVST